MSGEVDYDAETDALGTAQMAHNISLSEQFNNPECSDLVIMCGSTWHVHEVIVCGQVKAWKKWVGEPNSRGIKTLVLPESWSSVNVVHETLRYLYRSDYFTRPYFTKTEDHARAKFHCQIHAFAKRYGISELAWLTSTRFRSYAESKWNTQGFAQVLEWLYAHENKDQDFSGIKHTVVRVIIDHAKELYEEDIGTEFRNAAMRTPALTKEISQEVANRVAAPHGSFQSPSDQTAFDVSRHIVQCMEALKAL